MEQSYQLYIKKLFDSYKCKCKFDLLQSIPIYNPENRLYAYLVPIIADYKVVNPNYVSLLSQWRRENPTISTGTFEITDTRTENWLDKFVIGKDDRLIFMIKTLDGQPVGHIGYSSFNYEEQSGEIDSVLRGVKNKYPGIMTDALHSLLYWGLTVTKIAAIKLHVFSDNEPALKFYTRCGFSVAKNIPLMKIILPDEEKWEIAPADFSGKVEKYYTEMLFNKEYLNPFIHRMKKL